MNFSIDCLPPQAIDHESSILSACLLMPEKIGDILDELSPDHFYKTANKILFDAIKHIHKSGEPVDVATLALNLKTNENLEKIGGSAYLMMLMDVPIPSSIPHYCKTIKDAYLLRQTISIANDISQTCFAGGDAESIVDDAQKKIMGIKVDGGIDSTSFQELTEPAIERYESLYRGRGTISGVPTGFYMLDNYTCGFQKANLIILAARPSMGKSAIGMNITISAAKQGIPVGWFSLEMSKNELIDRSVAGEARINSNKFRSGYFQTDDWEKITSTLGRISKLPIYIDDSEGLHYSEIRRKARKMVKKFGCKMFFIDHLQLLQGDKKTTRDREIGSITASLKGMAKELDVPVVLVSQLNRSLETRPNPDKRPRMSDLRDSGNIEQDADVILFLYRREVYNDWKGFKHGDFVYSEPVQDPSHELKIAFEGSAELSVAKQRNGPLGGMNLFWVKKHTSFYDVEKKPERYGDYI